MDDNMEMFKAVVQVVRKTQDLKKVRGMNAPQIVLAGAEKGLRRAEHRLLLLGGAKESVFEAASKYVEAVASRVNAIEESYLGKLIEAINLLRTFYPGWTIEPSNEHFGDLMADEDWCAFRESLEGGNKIKILEALSTLLSDVKWNAVWLELPAIPLPEGITVEKK